MNISKCKTCKNYEPFFDSCNLYYNEVYVSEGEFDSKPVRIAEVDKNECEYKGK